MKKITLSLVLLLTLVLSGYGQVSYEYGFEPDTPPLGGWTTVGFSRQTITPCVGTASVRANTYSTPNSITSPSLGTSNGGVVTFSFDYKLLNWSANTVPTPANQVSIVAEWSNSATGPWFPVGTIDQSNHEVSTTCATKTFQFSPTPGALFVKITSIAVNGVDAYVYFDNIILSQGPAPTCVSPSGLAASAVEANSATLGWTAPTPAPSAGYEFYYSDVNAAPTAAGTPSTGVSANISGLTPNTNYYFWVRSLCGTDSSVWSGPIVFRTLCVPFDDFIENFTSTTAATGVVPNCWTKTIVSTNTGVNISVVSNTAASAPNAIFMTNSSDATAEILLASPALNAIGANTHRMKFKARGGTAGQLLIVGTMSDATNAATFTPLQTITLGTTYTTYNVSLNTSTTDGHVAFKHGLGGTFRSVYLDDVEWEPIPTAVPGCIEDMNAVINEGCGNFATTFTWAAVPGADGYTVSIGTAPNGGGLVVDNVNIFSVLNYSFVGNSGTTYYYTVRPYNALGAAVNCFEDSFTTFDDGCYCVSVPTSNDGAGVTNVQINDTNFPVTDVTYANLIENGAVEITQGVNTIMNVTLATGFSYATNVWIDFNNNYTFEPSELVFTGPEGPNTIPTVVNTSFVTPLTASIGEHRMRIVTTDVFQNPANPCYGGSYGVTIDLLVDVVAAPACLPPSASSVSNITANGATLNWVSAGNLFNVEVMFAGEPQGSGTITSGITGLTTTLSGLDAQANYAYYLQTNCGNGSLSPWTGPFTFRTACNPFEEFTENFTTDVTIPAPECWYTLKTTADQFANVQVSSFNDYVQMSNSNDAAAALYLITPALTDLPLNLHRIKFKAFSFSAGVSLQVGTMSDPTNASTFTVVQTIPMTNAFANYSVAFVNSTTNAHVAFKFVGTATFQSVNIDDVVWEVAPTCPDINVVTFVGATPNTANITWTPGGAETAWQYAYGLATLENPDGLVPVDVATTPAATIPGLAPSTTYKVWVRAACGSEFGIWSPATTFTTACVPVNTFPWTEGFEGTAGTAFPVCWSEENGDWVTADQASSSNYVTARTGSRFLRNSWSATNEYMWTPGFELTAGVSYDLSFYMQADGFTGWTVGVFQNTAQNSVGATQLGTTITASGTGAYAIQPYALVSNTIVPTTTGTYYFAVRVNQPSGTPWYIAFDDFRLEPTPTCLAPLAPTVANITITSATANWTATTPAPANGYDYFITSDLTLTPNATTIPTGTVAAGITTAELMGLSGSTTYKVFVRAICGATDNSSWSDAVMFTTDCVNAVLPYTINFENATVPALPSCTYLQNAGSGNNWRTANSPGYGFTSKVLNYPYSGANAANAWFFTNTMTLEAGTTYSVSYEYGNDFTFYTESLKVAYGTTANATSMTTEIANHPTINQATLQSNTATFTPTVSGDYVIGFQAYSIANQNQLYLDNIVMQVDLSNVDFDTNSFSAYPNPVKDVLNLNFTQNISQVAVYNLLGQKVLAMDMNATKGQVDMSNLATGTYLVKVNTENAVKTIKVIKQ
jgi:hypothetical protein